jgi:hypothetical protein
VHFGNNIYIRSCTAGSGLEGLLFLVSEDDGAAILILSHASFDTRKPYTKMLHAKTPNNVLVCHDTFACKFLAWLHQQVVVMQSKPKWSLPIDRPVDEHELLQLGMGLYVEHKHLSYKIALEYWSTS